MENITIGAAVDELAAIAIHLSEADLDISWKWGSYDNEGIRFAFFCVMEELRALAVRLAQARKFAGKPATQAQHILAQYHAAFRDLLATALGLDESAFTRAPAEGEWPIRKALSHILQAELGFTAAIRYALERSRTGDNRPVRILEDAWEPLIGLQQAEYESLMDRPADQILDYLAGQHARILAAFSSITDIELEWPSCYWEEELYPLRFRLHRYESHCRQHTIQIEKNLAAFGLLPVEPLRLMRLIYAALAEAEGALIGAEDVGANLVQATTSQVITWVEEIRGRLQG